MFLWVDMILLKKQILWVYILNTLSRIVDPIQIGSYHNDGILYISNSDGPKCSSVQKKIIRTFKFLGLIFLEHLFILMRLTGCW